MVRCIFIRQQQRRTSSGLPSSSQAYSLILNSFLYRGMRSRSNLSLMPSQRKSQCTVCILADRSASQSGRQEQVRHGLSKAYAIVVTQICLSLPRRLCIGQLMPLDQVLVALSRFRDAENSLCDQPIRQHSVDEFFVDLSPGSSPEGSDFRLAVVEAEQRLVGDPYAVTIRLPCSSKPLSIEISTDH